LGSWAVGQSGSQSGSQSVSQSVNRQSIDQSIDQSIRHSFLPFFLIPRVGVAVAVVDVGGGERVVVPDEVGVVLLYPIIYREKLRYNMLAVL
jgi:hypothetical protein